MEDQMWLGSNFKKGDLVVITERAKTFYEDSSGPGVIIDYWPANVYEGSAYDVLIDGNVKTIESKYLARG